MRSSAESDHRWFPSICVSLFGPSSWGNAPNILLTDTSSQKIVPRSSQDTVVCRWYCCCSSRTLSSSILWLLPLLLALFKWDGSDLPFLPHPRTPSPFSRSVAAILPSPSLPTLTRALPLAERWDSFTEAAGCQERWSPRRSRAECMWVTASQKEAFHPPLPPFFPLFSLLLLFVPLFLFGTHE